MDLQILKTELDSDSLGRGYSGMTNRQAADDMNLEYRTANRTTMSGSEAYDQTDPVEYTSLTDVGKNQWLSLCAISSVDPFGPAAQIVVDLFPPGGDTITNLQTARVTSISRGTEIGYGNVREGNIEQARLLV